nr:CHAT domain-containing protein [Planktothrix paucivesiculata]
MPNGFLYAGSPNIVSSLWTVDDKSTAFLMIRFYQNLHQGLSVALSLNQAQIWLRNITKLELERWIEEDRLLLDRTQKINLKPQVKLMPDEAKPFKSPFYWAAFCAIG